MSFTSSNKTGTYMANNDEMNTQTGQRSVNVLFLCLTFFITLVTLFGSVYSLVSLLRMRNKTPISLIVASLAMDDLLSVISVSGFMYMQWAREHHTTPLCAISALLYMVQGISSHLKASLIVLYNFYTTKKYGQLQTTNKPLKMTAIIVPIWIFSLAVSLFPLCGWSSYVPTTWGCFVDSSSSYVLFLVVIYSLCFCILAVLSVPLTYQLLCSDENQQYFHPSYQKIKSDYLWEGRTLASNLSYHSPVESSDKTLGHSISKSPSLDAGFKTSQDDGGQGCSPLDSHSSRNPTVVFAQKRFSLILAMTKLVLWLPIMIQMTLQHVTGFKSTSFEMLSFLLTLLAPALTPVFVLSEHWLHLPCGCIINCRQNVHTVSSESAGAKRKGFEFNLSFQQGYIYKISQANHCTTQESTSCHNLINSESVNLRAPPVESNKTANSSKLDFSTTNTRDSSLKHNKSIKKNCKEINHDTTTEKGTGCTHSERKSKTVGKEEAKFLDKATLFNSLERRLSHEENRKPELSDWEWCRSKSERTPRQKSSGGLAIPVCAFQGTVSLHAPTGKTLSLSTYEISSDGQKITPTSKKIEVYRSKSVGHEPNVEDSPSNFADTNVKIHLEVLEICDNEEAMDTVSIVSNISQSSAHARSPSLRYSRKENRFISCDLGETASYSLFIPTNNPDSGINISIPDTVEAHRRNSRNQQKDIFGYREEIQLLNEAYRKREEEEEDKNS
ncbi:probable G-protein coupled receptor 149 [Protopterus annectens]|uniref:probable G-protein coupled receptor 149 n=1 Tax=Protopterus annectens TaxID=7888 RepID=UPI001CFC38E1|nr:probable G-protein coupled receptor 149 [Protopterus annectens]